MAAVEAVRETGNTPHAAGNLTFVQARTANEVIKAQNCRIRLAKLKGDLADRSRAVSTVFALVRRKRYAWVRWLARANGQPTPNCEKRTPNQRRAAIVVAKINTIRNTEQAASRPSSPDW